MKPRLVPTGYGWIMAVAEHKGRYFDGIAPTETEAVQRLRESLQEHVETTRRNNFAGLQFFARELPALGLEFVPSHANFLLVRFDDAQSAFDRLLDAGVVVRDMRGYARLGDALRNSLGTPEQNDRVLAALASLAPGREAACA